MVFWRRVTGLSYIIKVCLYTASFSSIVLSSCARNASSATLSDLNASRLHLIQEKNCCDCIIKPAK